MSSIGGGDSDLVLFICVERRNCFSKHWAFFVGINFHTQKMI